VEPARVRADDFGDGGGEGNNVVLDLGFDFEDSFDVEIGALVDRFGGIFGNDAGGSQRFGSRNLNTEPGAEGVFAAQNAGHFRPRIARDHGAVS